MANETVLQNGLIIKGSLPDGAGESLLTIDADGVVGSVSGTSLGSALTDGYVFVGNASNVAVGVAVSGDITITNTGVVAVASGVIVNADINASAAIALTKLAPDTASRAVIFNSSGFLEASATTSTQVGYLADVTGLLQDQLDGKQATITGAATTIVSSDLNANRVAIVNASGKMAAHANTTDTEIGYVNGVTSAIQTQLDAKLEPTISSIAEGDILYYNGSEWVNLARGTNGQALYSTATSIQWDTPTINGIPVGGSDGQVLAKQSGTDFDADWETLTVSSITDITATADELNILDGVTVTSTEINYLSGASSNIQTQLGNKLSSSLAQNAIFVGNSSNVAGQLAAGTDGQVLTSVSGVPQWQTLEGTGTVTSVDVSGGTTGLSFTGGAITTTGTITASGTLVVANGGTGATSFTAGQILYGNGTSAISSESSLFWDATNNRLGIGTSSPSSSLDVVGVGSFSSSAVPINSIRTSASTTSISTSLFAYHVTTDDMANGFGSMVSFVIKDSAGVDNLIGSVGAQRAGSDDTGELVFRTTSAGVQAVRATLNSTGLGLGISPSARLHVSGSTRLDLGSDAEGDIFYRNSSGNVARLGIGSSGQVITVDTGLPSWKTPDFTSGTYTPTVTAGLNITSVSAFQCQYMRVGSVVTVSGLFTATPTATGDSSVTMTLPVASNLGNTYDCCGAGATLNFSCAVAIIGAGASDLATFRFVAPNTSLHNIYFSFTYSVI